MADNNAGNEPEQGAGQPQPQPQQEQAQQENGHEGGEQQPEQGQQQQEQAQGGKPQPKGKKKHEEKRPKKEERKYKLEAAKLAGMSPQNRADLLGKFNAEHAGDTVFVDDVGGEEGKKDVVEFLVKRLSEEDSEELERATTLSTLRLLAREHAASSQITHPDTVKVVIGCTKAGTRLAVVTEAIKLAVNTVIVSKDARATMLEENVFARCQELLNNDQLSLQVRGFCCRLVLHLTAVDDDASNEACADEDMIESLVAVLARASDDDLATPEAQSAVADAFKAMYCVSRNLSKAWEKDAKNPDLPERILAHHLYDCILPVMQQVVVHEHVGLGVKLDAFNMLMNLPPDVEEEKLVGTDNPLAVLNSVCDALDKTIGHTPSNTQIPLLGVLHVILKRFPPTRGFFYKFVFPPEECGPDIEQNLPEDNQGVEPKIALPRGSIRARFVAAMTDLNYNLKFYACENIYMMCDESPDELVRVAGVGRAAGVMAEKGLFGLPS